MSLPLLPAASPMSKTFHWPESHRFQAKRDWILAFSLLELLVALALLVILLGMVFGVIQGSATLATLATTRMDSDRTAREALEIMGKDLALAALPLNRGTPPYALKPTNSNVLQFLVNPTSVAMPANVLSDTIFWQAPVAHDVSKGNLAIVGYFVLRDLHPENPAQNRLQLRRMQVDASSKYYNVYSNPSGWLTKDIISLFAPSSYSLDNSLAQPGWLADGILGMWISCYDKTGALLDKSAAGLPLTQSLYTYDSSQAYNSPTSYQFPAGYCALPAFVKVTIASVSPHDMTKIANLEPLPANSTTPSTLYSTIETYLAQVAKSNPNVKSLGQYSRTFRILSTDP